MLEKELVDYLKENLAKGYSEEQLREALLSQGREAAAVEEAFAQARPVAEKPEEKHSWQDTRETKEEKPSNATATHIKRITMIVLVLLILGAWYYFFIFKQ